MLHCNVFETDDKYIIQFKNHDTVARRFIGYFDIEMSKILTNYQDIEFSLREYRLSPPIIWFEGGHMIRWDYETLSASKRLFYAQFLQECLGALQKTESGGEEEPMPYVLNIWRSAADMPAMQKIFDQLHGYESKDIVNLRALLQWCFKNYTPDNLALWNDLGASPLEHADYSYGGGDAVDYVDFT